MPSPNPTVRRQHSGNAKTTTLSAPIVNGTDTSFTIVDATGWPDGSVGNFVVTVNAGQSDVEKILCASRSGTTVNVAGSGRGFDGTTAAGHASSATVAHTISATEIDEANAHTAASSGVHGATGSVVGTSDTQTLTNKTVALGSNTVSGTTAQFNAALSDNDFATLAGNETLTNKTLNGATLDGASTVGGVSGATLAADRTAWTTYTPTFTNCTSAAGNFAYKLTGKTLHIRGHFTAGTSTVTATISVSLPASLSAADSAYLIGSAGAGTLWFISATGSTTVATFGSLTGGSSLAGAGFTGVIEVQ